MREIGFSPHVGAAITAGPFKQASLIMEVSGGNQKKARSKVVVPRWSSEMIRAFLHVLSNYRLLWDYDHPDKTNKHKKLDCHKDLLTDLNNRNFNVPNVDILKRKIKSLRDSFARELHREEASLPSGSEAPKEPFEPCIDWYYDAKPIWKKSVRGRSSSSNLVSILSLTNATYNRNPAVMS